MIKRPILIITMCYIIGILWGIYVKKYIPLFCIFLLCIITIFFYEIVKRKYLILYKRIQTAKYLSCINEKELHSNFIFFIICLIVIYMSSIYVQNKENNFKTIYQDNANIQVLALIEEKGKQSEYYNNYNIKVLALIEEKGKQSEYYNNYNIRVLNSKGTNIKLILKVKNKNNINLKCGDVIFIDGIFNCGEVQRNYKGFSYYQYLKTKNIYGICEADNIKIIYNDLTKINPIQNSEICKNILPYVYNLWINNIRESLKIKLKKLLPNNNYKIASAILLGDNSELTDEQQQLYSDASLSHILAISGMHVSYVIIACGFIVKKISKRLSKYIFIIFLIFFATLTGASPSVIRAVIMSILMNTAMLVYRKSDTLNNIAISALIILIINPYNLFNLGFQLSFLGTLGIVLFNIKINKILTKFMSLISKITAKILLYINKKFTKKFLRNLDKLTNSKLYKNIIQILSVSISANILIFPILIYNFNTMSLIFIISNLLVTPILAVLIFSGYIVLILSNISIKMSIWVAKFFDLFINIFTKISELSANLKFLKYTIVTPKIYNIVLLYIIIFFINFYFSIPKCKKHIKSFAKRNFIIFIIAIIIFDILTLGNTHIFHNKELTIHMVDVGQGDCTLIITNSNKTILIDGGGSETGNYDIGKKVVIPYLLDRQIKKIDYLIFSHFDADHAQGLISVIEELKVENVIIGKQFKESKNYKNVLQLIKEKNIKINVVEVGQRLNIENNICIHILWPNSQNIVTDNVLNNNSLVFKLVYKEFSILFTGDIEKMAEEQIIKESSNILQSTVIKIAHHGSKTSSTKEFLEEVKPKIALIGVGKKNKFGHPANITLQNLISMGCKIYRTDENGEITIKTDGKNIICRKFIK